MWCGQRPNISLHVGIQIACMFEAGSVDLPSLFLTLTPTHLTRLTLSCPQHKEFSITPHKDELVCKEYEHGGGPIRNTATATASTTTSSTTSRSTSSTNGVPTGMLGKQVCGEVERQRHKPGSCLCMSVDEPGAGGSAVCLEMSCVKWGLLWMQPCQSLQPYLPYSFWKS